jgi:hypothetical protein
MVMKEVISAVPRSRRIGVAQAKAHLSEALRDLSAGPVVIHSRGRDGVTVYDPFADEYSL